VLFFDPERETYYKLLFQIANYFRLMAVQAGGFNGWCLHSKNDVALALGFNSCFSAYIASQNTDGHLSTHGMWQKNSCSVQNTRSMGDFGLDAERIE